MKRCKSPFGAAMIELGQLRNSWNDVDWLLNGYAACAFAVSRPPAARRRGPPGNLWWQALTVTFAMKQKGVVIFLDEMAALQS
jgi:hypothetical protein